jgi:hypothetical protein|tara:strand:- start:921 stop:1109 length:189 start_codon:yes stop_codon:yes gene_type:complete
MIRIVREVKPQGLPIIYDGVCDKDGGEITFNIYPIITKANGVEVIGERVLYGKKNNDTKKEN